MNKIEKLRKIINESYCQECNDFGLCEYCEPKQTLVDIENVLSVYEYLLISTRSDFDYEKKVKKATESYRRLMEDKPKEIVIEEPSIDKCCVDDSKGLFDGYKCPYCGECYYQESYTTSTLLYCPTVIKNGKVVSKDLNTSTTHCHCLNCGKDFTISHQDGKTIVSK